MHETFQEELSQPVFTCSKLTIETLEYARIKCEICSKVILKTPEDTNGANGVLLVSLLLT